MPRAIPRKHFDASGKSAALFHHRAICKTPMALPDTGFFGAIAGKKSLPIEVHRPATAKGRLRLPRLGNT
jgi:hypothetical protein